MSYALPDQLLNFILENAKFNEKSNLLFTVTITSPELISEMERWQREEVKLSFGGLVGIKILQSQTIGEGTIFSASADYFKMDTMGFRHFVKKEPEVREFRS